VSTGLAADCEGEGDVVCNDDLEAYQCQVATYGLGYYVTRAPAYDVDVCGAASAGAGDTDSDGLSDDDEVEVYGTDFKNADTDGDGVSDGDEVNTYGTDPLVADSDSDGLLDGEEVTAGTDPLDTDSDDDTYSDYAEVNVYSTNPNDATSYPATSVDDTDGDGVADTDDVCEGYNDAVDTDSDGTPDGCDTDDDGDGLSDVDEATYSTATDDADTDDDGLTDKEEVDLLTDPLDDDTDGDGTNDGDEVTAGTDPLDSQDSPTCTDSDKDDNPTNLLDKELKGTTTGYKSATDTSSYTYTDECSSSTTLVEYYCSSGYVTSDTAVSCDTGCNDGACNYCTDSDGGIKYPTKGEVIGPEEVGGTMETNTDNCVDENTLDEYYCSDEGLASLDIYTCKYGCSAGKCIRIGR
jgi:hypothetical protein